MMKPETAKPGSPRSRGAAVGTAMGITAGTAIGTTVGAGLALSFLLLTACAGPPPRSFNDFMEDRIAMDGTLARCDQDPEAAQTDIECANARRASSVIALSEERARREALERESERKIAALKAQMEERDRIAREAALQAAKAAQDAYDRMWGSKDEKTDADSAAGAEAIGSTVDGAPAPNN